VGLLTCVTAAAQTLPAPPESPLPVVNHEYDATGNPTRTVKAPGVPGFSLAASAAYDRLDRATRLTDEKLKNVAIEYDGLGRTTTVTDPRGLVTSSPRDGLGARATLVSPDTGTTLFTLYDAAGNLLASKDAAGRTAAYTYDALGRLTALKYTSPITRPPSRPPARPPPRGAAAGASASVGRPVPSNDFGRFTWTYDEVGPGFANGIGRLTSAQWGAGENLYAYDSRGQLTADITSIQSEFNPIGGTFLAVGYGYDDAGHVTRIAYPSGRALAIAYSGGYPIAVSLAPAPSAAAAPLLSGIALQPFGGLQRWDWNTSSGLQPHERQFDIAGRLVRYTLGRVVRDLSYDAADRIIGYSHLDAVTGAAVPGLDQGFGYDGVGRLTGVTAGGSTWSITYDDNGNRTGVTLDGAPRVYATAATSNRLKTIDNPVRGFDHDATGNTTVDTGNGYLPTYGADGRLSATTRLGVTTKYDYRADGLRVAKSVGAEQTVFVYDRSGQLLGEYDATGTPLREYVWLGETPVAMFTPDPANPAGAPLVYFIHADHVDAPRVVLDRAGNVRWRWLAEPFGATAPQTNPGGLGSFTQNLRMPGQYADAETGLFYNQSRYYDPSIGRYAQSDPIGLAGGINTYSYVNGDPARTVDPEGLQGFAPTPFGPVPLPLPMTPAPWAPKTDPFDPDVFARPVIDAPPWWKPVSPDIVTYVEVQSCPPKLPPKPDCDAQFNGCMNLHALFKPVTMKSLWITGCFGQWLICKKTFLP
jgi:RHS repeat-associated protein